MSGWRTRRDPYLAAGRFTEAEFELIKQVAAEHGETVAAWTRRIVLEELDRHAG